MEDLNGGSTTQLIYLNTNDVWLETAATWNTAAPYNTVSIATGTFDPLKEKDIDAEGINHTYDVTNAVKNEPGGMISFRVAFDETVTDSFLVIRDAILIIGTQFGPKHTSKIKSGQ